MDWICTIVGASWEKLRYPLISVINLVALVFSLAGGFSIFWAATAGASNKVELVYAITLSLIVLFLLAALVGREVSVVRRRRIASSISKQAESFERLQTVWSVLQNNPDDSRSLEIARSILEEILTYYSEIYEGIIRSRCRFCIKLIEFIDNEYYVYTLARDRISARENRYDDSRRQRDRVDKLSDNSDFIKLWSQEYMDEGFFFSLDLSKENNYSSSSLNYRANILGNANRRTNDWLLPYRSAIVWPIRQEANSNLPNLDTDRCIGFLAVDTARPRVLRKNDAAIGQILARGLYPVLEAFANVDRETAQQENSGGHNV